MNHALIRVAFTIVALIGGIAVVVTILTNPGSSIASFARYLAAGIIALGFFGKRLPFYLLFFIGAYADLVKRFLVIEGRFSNLDIMSVLAINPLLMVALFANCLVRYIFSSGLRSRWHVFALIYGACISLASLGFALRTGAEWTKLLQYGANLASYAFLPFCILTVFPTTKELCRLLRVAVVIFLPVPLYGILQFFNGYSGFEYDYLTSGFTTVTDWMDVQKTRPYSTVASPGAFAFACGFLAMLAFVFRNSRKLPTLDRSYVKWFPWAVSIAITLFLFGGMLASKSRTQMLICMAALPLSVLFRSRRGTLASYSSLAAAVILLFAFSGAILDSKILERYQDEFAAGFSEKTGIQERYVKLSTMTIRVEGWRNLTTNPELWTLFGREDASEILKGDQMREVRQEGLASHDILTSSVISFGLVPVAMGGLIVALGLFAAHSRINRIPPQSVEGRLGRLGFAFFLLSYVGAGLAGGALLANPVPLFINISATLVIFAVRAEESSRRLPGQAAAEQTGRPVSAPGIPPAGVRA